MSAAYFGESTDGATRSDGERAAHWLCLAATPAFAIMALMTSAFDAGQPVILCSKSQGASPLSGMVLMYVLMSTFHSAPWLKLIAPVANRLVNEVRGINRVAYDVASKPTGTIERE